MSSEGIDSAQVMQALDDLRQQVSALGERLAVLETTVASQSGESGISHETVVALSAAIAAYLGKRPRIRQIRLLGSPSWAQEGRATIQASHALSVKRD